MNASGSSCLAGGRGGGESSAAPGRRVNTLNEKKIERMSSRCVVYNRNQVKILPNKIKFHLLH
jgi:hypothetical protein